MYSKRKSGREDTVNGPLDRTHLPKEGPKVSTREPRVLSQPTRTTPHPQELGCSLSNRKWRHDKNNKRRRQASAASNRAQEERAENRRVKVEGKEHKEGPTYDLHPRTKAQLKTAREPRGRTRKIGKRVKETTGKEKRGIRRSARVSHLGTDPLRRRTKESSSKTKSDPRHEPRDKHECSVNKPSRMEQVGQSEHPTTGKPRAAARTPSTWKAQKV
uniref:Uncharacterized protein n=1 Tax=Knipowitschia caucasica TaxID=637954 RepID=A0AAV2MV25_KNICA